MLKLGSKMKVINMAPKMTTSKVFIVADPSWEVTYYIDGKYNGCSYHTTEDEADKAIWNYHNFGEYK